MASPERPVLFTLNASLYFLLLWGTYGCGTGKEPSRPGVDRSTQKQASEVKRQEATSTGKRTPGAADQNGNAAASSPDWSATPQTLIRQALEAIREDNLTALNELRVSKKTYTEAIWPHFESSQHPKNTIPASFHWFMLDKNSLKGATRILHEYGGKELVFVSLHYEEIVDYGAYKLWRPVVVKVRNEKSDTLESIELFGSIVEVNGRFKFLAYLS